MRSSRSTLDVRDAGSTPPAQPICILCGASLLMGFAAVKDSTTGEYFSILRCPSCELGQTRPQPADLSPYYHRYHGGRHGLTTAFCDRRRLRFVHAVAGSGSGRKLLDIGCGEGTFLLAAKRAGWRVMGTEMNPSAARAAGLEAFEDLRDAGQHGPFDCATLWHSLEHLREPQATLTQICDLLPPEGKLLIAVPNASGWQARLWGPDWLHLDVPRHLYHFNPASLEFLLRATGFIILKSWHQEFEYDLLGWSQSALNKILPNPNVFFSLLTGRRPGVGRAERAANWMLGPLLTAAAFPLPPLSALFRAGGTVILAAAKNKSFRSEPLPET